MKYILLHRQRLWLQYIYDLVRWRLLFKHCKLTGKTFTMNGSDYEYLIHPYNHTWDNERAVEIPIMKAFLLAASSKRILEIGNVTSHYMPSSHCIIDKYETSTQTGLVNIDILDYHPPCTTYDLILSISTLEHVGWDETPRDPVKAIKALEKIRFLLSDSGQAVLTIPVGYNRTLDEFIYANQNYFDSITAMARESRSNRWSEVNLDIAIKAEFNSPCPAANALLILIMSRRRDCL